MTTDSIAAVAAPYTNVILEVGFYIRDVYIYLLQHLPLKIGYTYIIHIGYMFAKILLVYKLIRLTGFLILPNLLILWFRLGSCDVDGSLCM